jgi:predicted transcriptional regulator
MMSAMAKAELSIFDLLGDVAPEADEQRLHEAEADIAAGRLLPHEEVAEWLKTWGTPDFKPAPAHWFK